MSQVETTRQQFVSAQPWCSNRAENWGENPDFGFSAVLGVWCPPWTAQSTPTHQWDTQACPLEVPLCHNSITLGNCCQLPAVVVAQPGHIPAMPLMEAKGSVVLGLSLVMVSAGRKMVPVPRLCWGRCAGRSCCSPGPVKPLQCRRVGELQLARGWEGFSSPFGGYKPLFQSDKTGSPVP